MGKYPEQGHMLAGWPSNVPALLDLRTSYLELEDYPKAIDQFEKARVISGDSGLALTKLAQAHALSGNKSEAIRILQQLQRPSASNFVSLWDLALVPIAPGERKKAIPLLEQAVDEHVGWVIRLAVDPAFDSLRTQPEFKQLVKRIRIYQAT
jgi:adenylate cyclase